MVDRYLAGIQPAYMQPIKKDTSYPTEVNREPAQVAGHAKHQPCTFRKNGRVPGMSPNLP